MKFDYSFEATDLREKQFLSKQVINNNQKQQTTMAITGGEVKQTNFEPVKAGTHVAICYGITEVGTVWQTYEGKGKWVRKVRLSFELPLERKVFREGEGPKPFAISGDYTMPLYEKSKLRKHLEAWRGAKFTDDQAGSFDLETLLGKACMVTIIHKPGKDGRVYANLDGITGMPAGIEKPLPTNEYFSLNYGNFDWDLFGKQSEWIQDIMKGSKEYQALVNQQQKHAEQNHAATNGQIPDTKLPGNDIPDDLPF